MAYFPSPAALPRTPGLSFKRKTERGSLFSRNAAPGPAESPRPDVRPAGRRAAAAGRGLCRHSSLGMGSIEWNRIDAGSSSGAAAGRRAKPPPSRCASHLPRPLAGEVGRGPEPTWIEGIVVSSRACRPRCPRLAWGPSHGFAAAAFLPAAPGDCRSQIRPSALAQGCFSEFPPQREFAARIKAFPRACAQNNPPPKPSRRQRWMPSIARGSEISLRPADDRVSASICVHRRFSSSAHRCRCTATGGTGLKPAATDSSRDACPPKPRRRRLGFIAPICVAAGPPVRLQKRYM